MSGAPLGISNDGFKISRDFQQNFTEFEIKYSKAILLPFLKSNKLYESFIAKISSSSIIFKEIIEKNI